ncbi:MAG: PEP-CTERM sorting domain-containing protein [Phycisphaerae bacterium]|nr:PEP-CTERM sorting domain-containing protein [Phycisphaerae bacterium]
MARLRIAVALATALSFSATVLAATPDYVEDFTSSGSLFNWGSQADINWVPNGGVGGAADGYLSITREFAGFLGVASFDSNFLGDLPADGITGFSFWMNDIGADDPLEIHIGVGSAAANFWQSVQSFSPPNNDWGYFEVDLTDLSDWVQIQGAGTFADAIAASNRLLIRHDLAPYVWPPDALAGDFAIDRVRAIPEPATGLLALLAGGWVVRRRARRA